MKRILVATDGSVSSTEAVQFGVELAAEHDAELIFVHVVPVLDVVPSTGFGLSGAFPHEPTKADRALLDDAAAVAMEHGVVSTTALIRGETVDEIVAYADAHDVDVIVVGSRGRGAMTATLLGSVSAGVLREARRPVVVVRAGAIVPAVAPTVEAAR
jgi:nucleotide-binding universal stress UspA family protein